MRLRWGPHATRLAEQVVVSDPLYVIDTLDAQPSGALAAVFRDLIDAFDAKPLAVPCSRCANRADAVAVYPGSIDLVGCCDPCARLFETNLAAPASQVRTYEDVLRHVAMSFRRGHRIGMRRIVRRLLLAKAGPAQATEAAMLAYFQSVRPSALGGRLQLPAAIAETGSTRSHSASGQPIGGARSRS